MTSDQPHENTPKQGTDLSLSSIDHCDGLVEAFREFLFAELRCRDGRSMEQVVVDFSRRYSFLTRLHGTKIDFTTLPSLLADLTDARMAELVLDAVQSEGSRDRLQRYLGSLPFPQYEAVPDDDGLIIKLEEDGTRTKGRFIDHEFIAVENGQR